MHDVLCFSLYRLSIKLYVISIYNDLDTSYIYVCVGSLRLALGGATANVVLHLFLCLSRLSSY